MIDVMNIAAGTHLRLANSATVEVVENMNDGQWLMIRYLTAADEGLVGEEELCHASDVVAVDRAAEG